MNTLSISDIFSNLSFYQENYLSILQNSEHYYTEVEHAYFEVWPFGEKKLFLGDLLQLWFSEKWLINAKCRLLTDASTQNTQQSIQREHDLYLFQLVGSTFSGANHAKVWSISEQKVVHIALDRVFKYYCFFESIERPKTAQLPFNHFKHAI
ncbi:MULTISPECIES: hypothetical protein [Acinetobacter]|uniref:Uncharacterized protein n=1 Tax=Acinetobacter piscicola TaxID=2006115 RepID=A0A4Q4H364_9GAMM|nr:MULTISPECIES: hypothetical protein [Acinetobacter]QOW45408.1 hypothetical protein G0028_05585 [Acinetobacter piscicola]RYL28542.1 hypothetical protein EWP19_04185 [Acinetobacter piscicola]